MFLSLRLNVKSTWQTINVVLGRTKVTECDIDVNNTNETTENVINNHFINIIQQLKNHMPVVEDDAFLEFCNDPVEYPMYIKPVSTNEIREYFRQIKTKATGADDLSPDII